MEIPLQKHVDEIEHLESLDTNEGLSMTELTNYFKKVNAEFIKVMDKVDEIIFMNAISHTDINFFKGLDFCYYDRNLNQEVYIKHGDTIKRTIFEATLSESFNRSIVFFDNVINGGWTFKLNEYKIKFIQFGFEADFMIEFICKLYYNLNALYLDYHLYVYNSFVRYFDDFFDFYECSETANDEIDLVKRKQIYVDAIAESAMWCLSADMEEVDKNMHKLFVWRCKFAIKVIETQMLQSVNITTYSRLPTETEEDKFVIEEPISFNQPTIDNQLNNIKNHLSEYAFFELPKVKILAKVKQESLIELLSTNKLPYCIAMIDYLGFIDYLTKNYFKTILERNTEMATWFKTNERAIKGNINILCKNSGKGSNRYTANKHKEKVEIDYKKLI